MSRRNRQLNVIKDLVLVDDDIIIDEVPETTINDYEQLNYKCDVVISKIKNRKKKNQP